MIHTQQHYKGEHSAFYWAHALNLTAWEIDILRRVVRCRHKNQFQQDLQKIVDTLSIYKQECKYIPKRCISFWGIFDDMVKDLQLNKFERKILNSVLSIMASSVFDDKEHSRTILLINEYKNIKQYEEEKQ